MFIASESWDSHFWLSTVRALRAISQFGTAVVLLPLLRRTRSHGPRPRQQTGVCPHRKSGGKSAALQSGTAIFGLPRQALSDNHNVRGLRFSVRAAIHIECFP